MTSLILLTIMNILGWWMLVEALIANRRFPDEKNWIIATKNLPVGFRLSLFLTFVLFFGFIFWLVAVELRLSRIYEVFGIVGYLVALTVLFKKGIYKWPRFRKS
ncbi:MAG: hypothetical protein ACRCYY_03025 [Trueperaceae bacterium]